jgi:hypothetical protein
MSRYSSNMSRVSRLAAILIAASLFFSSCGDSAGDDVEKSDGACASREVAAYQRAVEAESEARKIFATQVLATLREAPTDGQSKAFRNELATVLDSYQSAANEAEDLTEQALARCDGKV